MDVGSFAIPVPKEKFDDARSLLAELNRSHLNELCCASESRRLSSRGDGIAQRRVLNGSSSV